MPTDSAPRIAVIVHTLNEAHNIEDCLATVVGYADDVLVVDMYSDDETVAIAERCGARVLMHERVQDFDGARTWSGKQVEADWVFYVDADQRVPSALWDIFRNELSGVSNDVAAISLPYRNYFQGRWMQCLWPGYIAPVLLRQGRFEWRAGVHEGVNVDGQVAFFRADQPELGIEHFSFADLAAFVRKGLLRYVPSEAAKMERAGQRFDWHVALESFGHDLAEYFDARGAYRDGGEGLTYSLMGATYRLFSHLSLFELHKGEIEMPGNAAEIVKAMLRGVEQISPASPSETAAPAAAPEPPKAQPAKPKSGPVRQKFSLYHADGQEAVQKQILAPWAELFKGRERVLDVGCGPGTFLDLLRERGIGGLGIDFDNDMVEYCQSQGLEAAQADARTLSQFNEEFDGVHASHVVEHMGGDQAVEFLSGCVQALRPGGLLAVRTPNWDDERVRNGNFWLDYSHVRPYPLPVLERIFEDLGLTVTQKGAEPYGLHDLYIVGEKPGASAAAAEPVVDSVPAPVVWSAPLLDPSGYADEARNFVLALDQAGWTLKANPIEWSSRRAELAPAEARTLEKMINHGAVQGDYVHVQHVFPTAFRKDANARATVGRTMFETDRLPADWVAGCNALDEIWVPSDFNLETFARAGVDPAKLRKLPGTIDRQRFEQPLEPLALDHRRGFNFLSLFDWSLRKGWDVLLRAYIEEFDEQDDVALFLKVHSSSGRSDQQIVEDIRTYARDVLGRDPNHLPTIRILTGTYSDQALLRLYRAVDAYVMPSRGEGWGRPLMEAMASGLPTIGTGWSGNTEFMTADNSYLIDYELADVAPDAVAEAGHFAGHRWAEPSAAHLREIMREVFSNPEAARDRGARARQEIFERFDRPVIASVLAGHLERLRGIPVTWEGSQFVYHSLAHVNREVCLALSEMPEVDLSIQPYEPHQFDASADARYTKIAERLQKNLGRPSAVHVRHQWPPKFEAPSDGAWVMIQPWEFGGLPAEWIAPMRDQVDEIWVPSSWVRECYIRSGVPADKVFVIPNGVDTSVYRPEGPKLALQTEKRFKFLFVGGTIGRKGIDVLVNAYFSTFTAADDVCLVIKSTGSESVYRGSSLDAQIRQMASQPNAPAVELISQDLSDTDIAALYRACDVLVHPYRGEGFGMPIAEAMASGLPVVVTGSGACLDFCDETNAYLIPASEVAIPEANGLPAPSIGYWLAEPDQAALAQLMREIVQNPEPARSKGQAGYERMQSYGWDHVGRLVQERISVLAARQPVRFAPVPLPLDGRRGTAFLLEPRWAETSWEQALLAYGRSFAATDDVTLVVRVDPDQGLSEQDATQRMLRVLERGGLDSERTADILIVADRLDATGLARLDAAVDVVVERTRNQPHVLADFQTKTWRAAA